MCDVYRLLRNQSARIDRPDATIGRLEIWADWLEHELLYRMPHRQFVFTLHKRLRPLFLFDRKLLGLLSRVASSVRSEEGS